MPLRDFRCTHCGRIEERFYHTHLEHQLACNGCSRPCLEPEELSAGASRKTGVFPMVNTNIDGKGTPIVVESLQHLRTLERTYGVVASAFSQDSVDSPKDLPEFRENGRAFEGERPRDQYTRERKEAVQRAIRSMETGKYRNYTHPAVKRG